MFCDKAAWGPTTSPPISCSPSCSSETPVVTDFGHAAGCARQRHSLTQMCASVVLLSGQVFFPGGWRGCLLRACTRFSPCLLSWAWPGLLAANKSRILAMERRTCLVLLCPAAHIPLRGCDRAQACSWVQIRLHQLFSPADRRGVGPGDCEPWNSCAPTWTAGSCHSHRFHFGNIC